MENGGTMETGCNNFVCTICYDIFLYPVCLPCNHRFCKNCFDQHIENNTISCPICRFRVSNWLRQLRRNNADVVDKPFWNTIQKLYPEEVEKRINGHVGCERSKGKTKSELKTKFSPEEVDDVPKAAIFQSAIGCSLCSYETKVRSNLVRHILQHRLNETVPEEEFVNPVPDKTEKMFDKMMINDLNDLAGSSHKKKSGPDSPKDETVVDCMYRYVSDQDRYKCHIKTCGYRTLSGTMLKDHISVIHKDESFYTCPHCIGEVDVIPIPIDQLGMHLKLHDSQVFKCAYCHFYSHIKRSIERHTKVLHPGEVVNVKAVRLTTPDQNLDQPAPKVYLSEKSDRLDEQWFCCNFCVFKTKEKKMMLQHGVTEHKITKSFKCSECGYESMTNQIMKGHFKTYHPDTNPQLISLYKKTVEMKKPVLPPIAPLWKRDAKRPKLIRGIKLDEKGDAPQPVATAMTSVQGLDVLELKFDHVGKPVGTTQVFKCAYCHFCSHIKRSIECHTEVLHPGEVVDVKAVRFTTFDQNLDQTAPEVYLSKKSDKVDEQWFCCNFCVFKTKEKKMILQHGVTEHKISKSFKCSECGYESMANQIMKGHFKTYHPDTNPQLISLYEKSLEVEKPVFPQIPPLWNKDAKQPTHIRGIKLGEKGNAPPPVATATTSVEGHDVLELKFGHLDKPVGISFMCPRCSTSFVCKNRQEMKDHLYKDFKYFPLVCRICKLRSTQRTKIMKHINRVHSIKWDKISEFIDINSNVELENWVEKVLSRQQSIMNKSLTSDVGEPEHKSHQSSVEVPSSPPPSHTDLSDRESLNQNQESISSNCLDEKYEQRGQEKRRLDKCPSRHRFGCEYCNVTTKYKRSINLHCRKVHPGLIPKAITLGKIMLTTPDQNLGQHAPKVYLRKKSDKLGEHWFCCNFCVFKTKEKKMMLQHGVTEHKITKSFKCSECGYASMTNQIMKGHFKTYHPDTNPQLISLYKKTVEVQKPMFPQIPPLWTKDAKQPKLIRGIKLDEKGDAPPPVATAMTSVEGHNVLELKFGHLGKPVGITFMCPRCFTLFVCKNRQEMKEHLYKDFKYNPVVCRICKLKSTQRPKIIKHINRVHSIKWDRISEFIDINSNVELENWVEKVLSRQQSIMNESLTSDVGEPQHKSHQSSVEVPSSLPPSHTDLSDRESLNQNQESTSSTCSDEKYEQQGQEKRRRDKCPSRHRFGCEYCNVTTKYKHSIILHCRKFHPGLIPKVITLEKIMEEKTDAYNCMYCNCTALNLNNMKHHWSNAHKNSGLSFLFRSTVFNTKLEYECYWCKKRSDLESLEEHCRKEHSPEQRFLVMSISVTKYKCSECTSVFKSIDMLKKHFPIAHPSKQFCYIVVNAQRPPSLSDQISVRNSPPEMSSKTRSNVTYKCFNCPYVSPQYQYVVKHIQSHFVTFVCSECGIWFISSAGLSNHRLRKHPSSSAKPQALKGSETDIENAKKNIIVILETGEKRKITEKELAEAEKENKLDEERIDTYTLDEPLEVQMSLSTIKETAPQSTGSPNSQLASSGENRKSPNQPNINLFKIKSKKLDLSNIFVSVKSNDKIVKIPAVTFRSIIDFDAGPVLTTNEICSAANEPIKDHDNCILKYFRERLRDAFDDDEKQHSIKVHEAFLDSRFLRDQEGDWLGWPEPLYQVCRNILQCVRDGHVYKPPHTLCDTPRRRLAKQGEIHEEYEKLLKKELEEKRRKEEENLRLSEAMIQKIEEEERREEEERFQQLLKDEELARRLEEEGTTGDDKKPEKFDPDAARVVPSCSTPSRLTRSSINLDSPSTSKDVLQRPTRHNSTLPHSKDSLSLSSQSPIPLDTQSTSKENVFAKFFAAGINSPSTSNVKSFQEIKSIGSKTSSISNKELSHFAPVQPGPSNIKNGSKSKKEAIPTSSRCSSGCDSIGQELNHFKPIRTSPTTPPKGGSRAVPKVVVAQRGAAPILDALPMPPLDLLAADVSLDELETSINLEKQLEEDRKLAMELQNQFNEEISTPAKADYNLRKRKRPSGTLKKKVLLDRSQTTLDNLLIK